MSEYVKGAEEIIKKLEQLEKKTARKIVSSSLKEGLKPTLAVAVTTAPVLTGRFKESIKLKAGKKSRLGPSYKVFSDIPEAGPIEYGHTKKSGTKVEGKGTLRKAYDSTKDGVRSMTEKVIVDKIEQAVNRA